MTSKQLYWTDAHFCGLRSQTNVYGLTKITSHDGLTRLLAVSLDGHFITVEYQKSFDNRLIPITREGEFCMASAFNDPDVAEDFEVVSVDMFYQDKEKKDIILAVTYLRSSLAAPFEEKAYSAYMNIYYLADQEGAHINLIDAINVSQIQNLDYFPLQLLHHRIKMDTDQEETCLILSGNDNKVHVFRQKNDLAEFDEDQDMMSKYFPEFTNVNGCVTQMVLKSLDSSHRLSALGVQSGQVTLFLVNTSSQQIEKRWETDMDSPITSIQLFSHQVTAPYPDFLNNDDNSFRTTKSPEEQTDRSINLLITSAIDPAVVFCDVLESDLSKRHVLPLSNSQDVVLCSCIMDIDFDGENEILIGTYGQVLLAYKLTLERTPGMLMTSTPFPSPKPVPVGGSLADLPAVPVNDSDEKSSSEQVTHEKSDRRRHKSLAGILDSNGSPTQHEKHNHSRFHDSSLLSDVYLRDGQTARLVRSQENLTGCTSPRSVYFQTPDNSDSFEFLPHGSLPDHTEYPSYRLKWTKRFSDPVMGLTCDDMMRDGMLDLVVLTLKGLHILQPDLNEVAELLLERLKPFCDPTDRGNNVNADSFGKEDRVDS
ncbi:kaptin-like [Elysia marginata]|uniref:Kaptin-like n=1 Tax=Elysia marginata TaxID=1093978 RepID=A0AAV4IPC3_9GAST|nr:kaptin-like [Elysia marginata]